MMRASSTSLRRSLPARTSPDDEPQRRFFEAGVDQIILQRALVLEILLGFAARDFVERRLRDVEMAAVDQLAHLPVEEGQQQRADMRRRRRRRRS